MIFVKAFEGSKYKVEDCTNEPFVGINVTTDEEGNYYLDQKRAIKGVIKAARLSGAKIHILPYPLDGKSLSKEDNNAKDDAELESSPRHPSERSSACSVTSLETLNRTSHMPS